MNKDRPSALSRAEREELSRLWAKEGSRPGLTEDEAERRDELERAATFGLETPARRAERMAEAESAADGLYCQWRDDKLLERKEG